jgi:hypothetical protein
MTGLLLHIADSSYLMKDVVEEEKISVFMYLGTRLRCVLACVLHLKSRSTHKYSMQSLKPFQVRCKSSQLDALRKEG